MADDSKIHIKNGVEVRAPKIHPWFSRNAKSVIFVIVALAVVGVYQATPFLLLSFLPRIFPAS
jgi:hypothetical protein